MTSQEVDDLRRQVAELQGSLSWKITAPLRFVSKPLFKAKAPGPAVPAPAPAPAPPAVPPAPSQPPIAKPDAGVLTSPTIRAVAGKYGINPQFARGVLGLHIGTDYDPNLDVPALLNRYPDRRTHLEYALTTNQRGQALIDQLRGWGVPIESHVRKSKQYLDIGFAYGGCLASFSQLGFEVTGIEIDEKYGRLGRWNLESFGPGIDTRIGDFQAEHVVPADARFDIITCTDVIEHVADPEASMHKICRLLKPGGVAYIAYPTKLCISYVRADAHFGLFGLTLLDYFRARAAHAMYTGRPEYEVSDFYEPEWYLNTARSAGVSAELVYDSAIEPPDVAGEIARLQTAYSEWTRSAAQKLDPLMRHEITREFALYSARLFQDYSHHIAQNSVDQFARKWLDPLTRILIRKPTL